jgi:hypothetical protein
MHSLLGVSNASASDGIMGASPSATPSASATTTSPSPPPPLPQSSDRIPCGNQVNSRFPAQDSGHGDGDRTDATRLWMPKMDFPMFDGTDVRIWLDNCLAYFAHYQIPAISSEFEGDVHRAKTMELLSLNQKGSVEEYRREFE